MLALLLLSCAAARHVRSRHSRRRTNDDTKWPYFVASKRYEPADYPDETEETLPMTEAEKFEQKKIRAGKKEFIEQLVANEVADYLAEIGVTSELASQLKMAKMISNTLDVFINGAQAELRKRRRLIEA